MVATLKPVWQIDRAAHDARRQQREDQLEPAAGRERRRAANPTLTGASTTLTLSATDDGLPKRRGEPVGLTVFWAKYRGPGDGAASRAPSAKLVNGKATTSATLQRAGRVHPAGGGRRRIGRVGRQLRLSLLLDQRAGEDHGRRRRRQSAIQSAVRNPQSAISPTFAKDVAPIFQTKCQTCHHPGTSAPMSLVTYDEVRPWARSIRQRVANRDMPPWHLDKTVGIRHYKNDRSLSDDEIATIVRWVDAGAPQGNPADMPAPLHLPVRRRLVHRRAGSEGDDAERLHDVRERPRLVDRSVRRRRAHRGSLDQGDGDQAEQPEDRPSRRGLRDRAGRAGRHAGDRRAAARVRGRQVRRHLRRQHRPAAEEGHAAALRHALLRDRLRAAQQDDDRVQVLSEGRHAEVSGAVAGDAQHPERRARGAAQHRGPHRRLLPAAAPRAHRRVPAAHAHARPRHDARGDRSGRPTARRSSARSITSTSTGTSTTSTPTTRRRCCRRARCCT